MRYKSKTDQGMSAKEIFTEINKRQIIAQMFHREIAVYFAFLGMQGFKRMHQFRHMEEAKENESLLFWIIDNHNMVIDSGEISAVAIIPKEWYTVSRLNVGQNTKTTSTKTALESWREWEDETLHVYEEYAKQLLDSGNILDYCRVSCLIQSTGKEVKKICRLIEDLQAVGYDMGYIVGMQQELHDKYKKKMHL